MYTSRTPRHLELTILAKMNYAMYTSDEYLQRLIYKLYKMFISRDTHLLRQYIGVTETEILHWLQSTVDARDVLAKEVRWGWFWVVVGLSFSRSTSQKKKLAIKWKNIFLPDRTPKIYSPLFNCYYRTIMPTAQIVNPLGFDRHQCLLI